jgi:hypothetical protein
MVDEIPHSERKFFILKCEKKILEYFQRIYEHCTINSIPRERDRFLYCLTTLFQLKKSRGGSVGIATGYYELGDRGSRFPISGGRWEFFSSPPRPDQLWGPPSGRGMKLTTHLLLVPRSRMRGALPLPSKHVFMAWCSVKHRDNFTVYLWFNWWRYRVSTEMWR